MSAGRTVGALLLGLALLGAGCSGPRADGQPAAGAAPRVEPGEPAEQVEPSADLATLSAGLEQRLGDAREQLAAVRAVQRDVAATARHVGIQARAGSGLAGAAGLATQSDDLTRLATRADELGGASATLLEELQRVEALVDAYARWAEWQLESGSADPEAFDDGARQLTQVGGPRERSDALAERAGMLSLRLEELRRAVAGARPPEAPVSVEMGAWVAGEAVIEVDVDAPASGSPASMPAAGNGAAAPVARAASATPRAPSADVVELVTSQGALVCELFDDVAPHHTAKFRRLVREGFYDGLTFHRIVPDYWVHGGCPLGTGAGGDGKQLRAEFSDLPFERGSLAMARMAHPDSASTQFLIGLRRLPELDSKYTIFGRVIRGNKVLDAIAALGTDEGLPTSEVVIERATLRARQADETSRSLADRQKS